VKLKNANLLVVDDREDTVRVMSKFLQDECQNVYIALGVSEAMEILQNHTIDIVISDYEIDHLSGFDLLDQVRPNYPQTFFVLITAYQSLEQEAMQKGVDLFFKKPIMSLDNFIEKLEGLFE